jgi:hypothetical protein
MLVLPSGDALCHVIHFVSELLERRFQSFNISASSKVEGTGAYTWFLEVDESAREFERKQRRTDQFC